MGSTRLRVLDNRDLSAVVALLQTNPVENLFVASRVQIGGLDSFMLGCQIWGFERDGELVALCHAGSNIVPIGDDQGAIEAFARKAGPRRRASSIMGNSGLVLRLWEELGHQWGRSWSRFREIRPRQPLMAINTESGVAADPRVRPIRPDEFELYFPAAVSMYTEEVGVSPLDSTNSYQAYVARLIEQGKAFGIVEDDRVVFKADVGSATASLCQVQGVWLDPSLRGTGVALPAMAQVVALCRRNWPIVTLYVNDFNVRAVRLYEHVGFSQVGEFATVLY